MVMNLRLGAGSAPYARKRRESGHSKVRAPTRRVRGLVLIAFSRPFGDDWVAVALVVTPVAIAVTIVALLTKKLPHIWRKLLLGGSHLSCSTSIRRYSL